MKPLLLEIEGFLAYPTRQVIDFTRFQRSRLLLIHGPTGAGKTAILDAICYALFDQSSGSERAKDHLRCQLSSVETPTMVRFEWEMASGLRYRVRRSPEFERPRRRGEGTARQQAQAELHLVDPDGSTSLLAAQPRAVAEKVEEILGLEPEQFRQVIMLPQGRFRELLTCSSADREKVLRALFNTRHAQSLQEALKAEAAGLRRECDGLQERLRELLEGAGAASREELEQRQTEAHKELAAAAEAANEAGARATESELALRAGEAAAVRLERLAAAELRLQKLQRDDEELSPRRRELESAVRAEQVRPLVEIAAELEKSAAAAGADLERRRQAALEAEDRRMRLGPILAELTSPRREQEREDAAQAVRHLEESRRKLVEIERRRKEIGESELLIRGAEAQARAHGLQMGQSRDLLKKLEEEHAAAAAAERRRAGLLPSLTAVEALAGSLRRRDDLLKQLERTEMNRKKQQQRALDCAEREEEQQRRLAEMERAQQLDEAARIARRLQAGEPCPACGSRDHPNPAPLPEFAPGRAELEAARAALQAARDHRREADAAVARYEGEASNQQADLDRLLAELGDGREMTAAEAEARCAALNAEAARLALESKPRAVLEQKIAAVRADLEAGEKELQRQRDQQSGLLQSKARLEATLEALQGELPAALLEEGALTAALAKALKLRDQLNSELNRTREEAARAENDLAAAASARDVALRTLQERQADEQRAAARLQEGLRQAAFDNLDGWRRAHRPAEWIGTISKRVADHDRELDAARRERQAAGAEAEGLQPPDLQALREAAQEATKRKEESLAKLGELRKNTETIDGQLKRAGELLARRLELEKQWSVAHDLDLAAGGGSGRITFESWLLGRFLDSVLVLASRRLSEMSRGRYTLVRSHESRDGRRRYGLDLNVMDASTARERPAHTLSGGEGFQAALALALGLSDLVQQQTGGMRLETLFIDEGFGSLDQEALDLAMGVLADLQAEGRLVAVISHVEELKRAIPCKLEVIPDGRGSRIRAVY